MTNPALAASFNGRGFSYQTFKITAIGILLNMVLDPLFIFGAGPLPALGTRGAAFATIIGQLVVFSVFSGLLRRQRSFVEEKAEPLRCHMKYVGQIVKIGFPASVQNILFPLFAMAIAKILSQWGPGPIAVQKIGASVEAFSWATAFGFSSALGVFVGQNYGSLSFERILKGYHTSLVTMAILGILTGGIFVVFSKQIIGFFLDSPAIIAVGVDYFRIIGLSQVFMCMEITAAGAFNGYGHTMPPAFVSIVLNTIRIPLALYLSSDRLLGLNGVWWTLSLTSVAKGILLMFWFSQFFKRFSEKHHPVPLTHL
jgi:putative MATE family efflux protein